MGNKSTGGPFAPLVVVVRNVVGDKEFNKLRGKAISLHSQGKHLVKHGRNLAHSELVDNIDGMVDGCLCFKLCDKACEVLHNGLGTLVDLVCAHPVTAFTGSSAIPSIEYQQQ